MDPRGPEKKERLLAALEKGMVMVHLDARRPGVAVPDQLRGEAHLRLNLSYRFDPPDLSVGEWGVRQTLSFSGSRFSVAVPWSALFAITSQATQELWMFPEDLPPELLKSTADAQAAQAQTAAPQRTPPAGRARLREVERLPDPPESDQDASPPAEPPASQPEPAAATTPADEGPPKPKRPHLRVVK